MGRDADTFGMTPPETRPDDATDTPARKPKHGARLTSARWIFWLLFSINAVNYLDRLLVVAVGPTLKAEFHLTDRSIGYLSSAFLLVYTVATLPLGILADRVTRAKVVAVGVALWSVMSGATAFVTSFAGLFITRTAVGVGEASYFPAGTALLSAYFPVEKRAQAISRWGAGQVIGAALAFVVSAITYHWLGSQLGWRVAFLVTAAPGLLLAALIWQMRDAPERPHDGAAPTGVVSASLGASHEHDDASVAERIREVLSIGTVRVSIILQALTYIVVTPTVTFLPIYMRSHHTIFHLGDAQVSLLSGAIIVIGGLSGTLLGGYLADWLSARVPGGRLLTVGLAYGVGFPFYVVTLLTHALPIFVVMGTLAVVTLNLQVGPLGAVVQDATPARLRASAVAVGLLVAHLLGDSWSPTAVGALSTAFGERTALGLLYVSAPALVIATVVAVLGRRVYVQDLETRVREDLLTGEQP